MSNIAKAGKLTPFLFDCWKEFLDAKPRTVEEYTRIIRIFRDFLTARGVTNPAREDVIAFRDHLKENHKAATVQAYIMGVRQFFKWTAANGFYPNIAEHIKGARIERGFKRDYLTVIQVKKLLGAIDRRTLKGKRDFALLAIMVTTGLRTVEVAGADVGDVRPLADFTALYIKGKGRDDKAEYVKVEPPVEEALRKYLKARGAVKGDDPLFCSTARRNAGGRMTTRSISRLVKGYLRGVDLDSDRLTAHSLRHTAATLNLLNGGTPEETRQLLRHANISTTMIYSHAIERAKNQSEARITAAIFGEAV